jgi:hypothetical protein
MLDTKVLLRWNIIQFELQFAVERLLSHHKAPKLRWIIPTVLGCTGSFRRVKDLREKVANSRDWFSVPVAALSYAIAVSMTLSDDPLDGGIPHWFYYLYGQQMEQLWLSGIQASSAGTFSPYVARAGMLLKVLEPERGQFSVDWLCRFHVPVWYPWGAKEAQAAISDCTIARLAPLTHQLQELGTVLTKVPELKTSDSKLQNCISSLSILMYSQDRLRGPKPWEAFFAERALRNERCKERETPKQRQSREDREKNPPTKKCKVYIWRRDGDGGYTRESIFQSENEEELDFYGRNQKVYDAFTNCWDLCDDFGAVEPDEFDPNDDDDDFFPSAPNNPPSIASASHAPSTPPPSHFQSLPESPHPPLMFASGSTPPPSHLQSSSESPHPQPMLSDFPPRRREGLPIPGIATSGYSYEEYETAQIIHDFFGFVAPLPLPLTLRSPLDKKSKDLIVIISGLGRDDAAFFDAPVAPFAAEFLSALSTGKAPKNQSWDLSAGNRMSLMTAKRLEHLYVLDDVSDGMEGSTGKHCLYLFDFKQAASMPWIIAVHDPTDALFLCRLDPSLTDYELARELLNRGIRFHTLLSLQYVPPSPPIPISIPLRLPEYVFTSSDYRAYVQQRSALLADPRVARAALMRGGIVWRLAMATLSFDDVLYGPTAAVTLHRRGVSFKTRDSSVELCDDGLTQAEYDIICGLHHCYSGKYI